MVEVLLAWLLLMAALSHGLFLVMGLLRCAALHDLRVLVLVLDGKDPLIELGVEALTSTSVGAILMNGAMLIFVYAPDSRSFVLQTVFVIQLVVGYLILRRRINRLAVEN